MDKNAWIYLANSSIWLVIGIFIGMFLRSITNSLKRSKVTVIVVEKDEDRDD